jgi:hypothetical protein
VSVLDEGGYPDGPNNYLYVNNNPINAIDPMGLEATRARKLFGKLAKERISLLQQGSEASQWLLTHTYGSDYMFMKDNERLIQMGIKPYSYLSEKAFYRAKLFEKHLNAEGNAFARLLVNTEKMNGLAVRIEVVERWEKDTFAKREIIKHFGNVEGAYDAWSQEAFWASNKLQGGAQDLTIPFIDAVTTVTGVKTGVKVGLGLTARALRYLGKQALQKGHNAIMGALSGPANQLFQFSMVGGPGLNMADDAAKLIVTPKSILFGQKRIAPHFKQYSKAHPSIMGRKLIDVIDDLRAGNINADDFLIHVTRTPKGQ